MAAWSGFTDEDLRKIKGSNQKEKEQIRVQRQATSSAAARKQRPSQRIVSHGDSDVTAQVDPSMRLGGNKMQSEEASSRRSRTKQNKTTENKSQAPIVSKDDRGSDAERSEFTRGGDARDGGSTNSPERELKELDQSEAMSVEMDNMQKFQQQQKVIEEANKLKRALLARAIADRHKKAKAEADKLVKVQQELNHLDSLLTADVSIIRDKIEQASLEYMDAQKRYERLEKEFIAAKMDLHTKGETKESLTEHLYTIIHQNEVRKARKLVELMEKLAMEVTPEEMELTMPVVPQLANFTAVSTLHDPNDPHHPLNVALKQQAALSQQQVLNASSESSAEQQSQQHSQLSDKPSDHDQNQQTRQSLDSTVEMKQAVEDISTSTQPASDGSLSLNTTNKSPDSSVVVPSAVGTESIDDNTMPNSVSGGVTISSSLQTPSDSSTTSLPPPSSPTISTPPPSSNSTTASTVVSTEPSNAQQIANRVYEANPSPASCTNDNEINNLVSSNALGAKEHDRNGNVKEVVATDGPSISAQNKASKSWLNPFS